MKEQTKLMLKNLSAGSGESATKEIHSLDEVKNSGNYLVIGRNISVDNGMPLISGKTHNCFCCEAQLTVTCCYPESESQSDTAYGQTLTICDRETGVTNSYTRTITPNKNSGNWSEWQMVATGDINLVTNNNEINEALTLLSVKTNSEIARESNFSYDLSRYMQFSPNLYNVNSAGVLKNKKYKDNVGNLADSSNTDMTHFIAVEPNEQYYIPLNSSNTVHYYDINFNHLGIVGNTSKVYTMPEGARWIRFFYSNTWTGIRVIKGNKDGAIEFGLIATDKIADNAITFDKLSDDVVDSINTVQPVVKDGYYKISGNLNESETLKLPKNSVSIGEYITFTGTISGSFGSLLVGHGKTEYTAAYIKITSTEVTVYSVISPTQSQTNAHGLTIENNIQVYIGKQRSNNVNITISSNGRKYSFSYPTWYGNNGQPFAECETGSLTDCTLSWTCKGIKSDVWVFGDSYLGVNGDTSWSAYLINGNHTNLIINSFGGQNSASALTDFQNLLAIGQPKKVLWCLGMNDGDSSTAINSNWQNAYNSLRTLCEQNNIELVLATIPTVPSITHKYKNAVIKSSGLRYVDFEKAVGANESTGEWYSDMLSSDNVHPSATGALTLYNQAIADIPELLNC